MARRFVFSCSRQPSLDETIEEVHEKFLTAFCKVQAPWGRAGFDDCRFDIPPIKHKLLTMKSFTKMLGRGVFGSVRYMYRHPNLTDTDNDHISIYFNVEKADITSFIHDAFSIYCRAFDAFRANIWDEEIHFREGHTIDPLTGGRAQVQTDPRREVDRIYQCEYWGRDLCRNAFGLTPAQIADRVKDAVEHVEATEIGVWLVYRSTVMSEGEILTIDGIIRPLLERFPFVVNR